MANGTTTITATAGAVSASAPVTVQQAVASVAVTPTSASIAVGGSTAFNATARDANGYVVAGATTTWSSGNPGIATVDGTGNVTGLSAGATSITAMSGGRSQIASVTVTAGGGQTILFQEQFEDANFGARGWYDGGVQVTASQAHSGNSAGEFHFAQGANVPSGRGMRHLFTETGSFYLSFWVKYGTNWIGSGGQSHPHEFLLMTNEEGQYAGPAATHLTVYVEHNYQNGGIPRLVGQDALNIDVARVGQDLTGITENRSAHGCNGLSETSHTSSSCYQAGAWSNDRYWDASQPFFTEAPGSPGYKNNWHFVEAFIKLNSIQGGIGQTDGVLQYWFDGQLAIDHHNVLLRTGAHPTMRFNQLLMAPYIGSGSPVDQTMWIDELTVATGR